MAGLLEISTACNSVFCFPNTTTYTYKERVFTGGLTWKENSHSSTSAFSISQCSFWWPELVCVVFWAAVKYSEKFCSSQGQLNTLAFFFFSFKTGRNNHLVKFSKWLPVTAGKDITWFWQVRRERRNWSWDFFFFLFHLCTFLPNTERFVFLTGWCRKQHICDPRRKWKMCLITESADIAAFMWISEGNSLKDASSERILWLTRSWTLESRGCSLWTKGIFEPTTRYGEEQLVPNRVFLKSRV